MRHEYVGRLSDEDRMFCDKPVDKLEDSRLKARGTRSPH